MYFSKNILSASTPSKRNVLLVLKSIGHHSAPGMPIEQMVMSKGRKSTFDHRIRKIMRFFYSGDFCGKPLTDAEMNSFPCDSSFFHQPICHFCNSFFICCLKGFRVNANVSGAVKANFNRSIDPYFCSIMGMFNVSFLSSYVFIILVNCIF